MWEMPSSTNGTHVGCPSNDAFTLGQVDTIGHTNDKTKDKSQSLDMQNLYSSGSELRLGYAT